MNPAGGVICGRVIIYDLPNSRNSALLFSPLLLIGPVITSKTLLDSVFRPQCLPLLSDVPIHGEEVRKFLRGLGFVPGGNKHD